MNFEKTDTHSDVTLFKMFVCLSISVLMVLLSFFWSLDKVGKELEFLASKKEVHLGPGDNLSFFVYVIVRVRNKLTDGAFMRWCNNTFTCWCLKCRQGKYMPSFVPSQASIFGLA